MYFSPLFLELIYLTHIIIMCCGSIFFFGLEIFKPVWFLFSFVWDYDNESEMKESTNYTGLKIFKSKKNLNHSIHISLYKFSRKTLEYHKILD